MSGVTVKGKVPTKRKVDTTLDGAVKAAARGVSRAVMPVVRDEAPGGLGAAMEARTKATPTGYQVTIAASPRKRYKGGGATGAQVVRWVTRGTGVHRKGPGRKRPIKAKKRGGSMTLPGGTRVRSVKGQRPNPFVGRAKARATAEARRAAEQNAKRAATALRRL